MVTRIDNSENLQMGIFPGLVAAIPGVASIGKKIWKAVKKPKKKKASPPPPTAQVVYTPPPAAPGIDYGKMLIPAVGVLAILMLLRK